MENVDVKVEGNILVLRVDLSKSGGPSKTGKTVRVASSCGNVKVPGHDAIQFGLNVFKKDKKA